MAERRSRHEAGSRREKIHGKPQEAWCLRGCLSQDLGRRNSRCPIWHLFIGWANHRGFYCRPSSNLGRSPPVLAEVRAGLRGLPFRHLRYPSAQVLFLVSADQHHWPAQPSGLAGKRQCSVPFEPGTPALGLFHDQIVLYRFDPFHAPCDVTRFIDGFLRIDEAAQLNGPLESFDTDLE